MVRVIVNLSILLMLCAPLFGADACTRASLQAAVDGYISAQQAGDPALMPLANGVKYTENMAVSSIDQSIMQLELPIAFHRNFLDVDQCKTFSEVIVTEGEHPYVIGIRLELHKNTNQITKIDAIVTDEGDWEFDAASYFNASSNEDWRILPQNQRVDRQTLIDAANAYFDMFTYTDIKVPYGIPCARLEGGKYTGDGPRASCKVGVPLEGIDIVDRSFVRILQTIR